VPRILQARPSWDAGEQKKIWKWAREWSEACLLVLEFGRIHLEWVS
jgi:hypothetical protein